MTHIGQKKMAVPLASEVSVQMVSTISAHLQAGRDVFAYFKHEETPQGALYAVEVLRGIAGSSQ